ncbi:SEC-C metal-binding domain-containing protein [Peribacillus frigoritolerans]|uniref:SEC-C metal-binding domain-containing protein n=1 Tax=Peribacillus frigoritolerans TaxID=450367 RepID=UPI0038729A6E
MDLKDFKSAINDSNIEVAANILVELYMENPNKFRKSLLLSNSLPEPIEKSISDNKIKNLLQAFLQAGLQLVDKDVNISKYASEFRQLSEAIRIINQNSKSNLEQLEKNTFLEYSLSEQLQMFCIYIEDQHRLSNEIRENDNKKFITGLENVIAKYDADNMEGVKISETDRLEALIEIADTLFRFLYFKGRKSIERQKNFEHENITPYGIESLEEIMHLAVQRDILVDIWGKYKYREWQLGERKEDGVQYKIFYPPSNEDYKKERIAINRYIYRDHINVQRRNSKFLKENQESLRYMQEVASKLDVNNINSLFQINKSEYFQSSVYIGNLHKGQLESLDDIYYGIEHEGIKITELFKGFEYLFTIASIYQNLALKGFNQEDISHYKRLSPIIDKVEFIKQFSYLYEIEYKIAESIVDIFTFSNKPLLDVFSQPLIYVGQNKVIFCPTLILQMNIVRIVEMLVTEWNIDIASKGVEFERQLRFILSFNPHIQVNTNKIEFKAYDGRDVEFDFIGLFNDHLLLIEFKHVRIPFSDKMKKNALDTIDFGIEQVNRREAVLKHDWEKVREKCSFELPEKMPSDDKIIKLTCTNIFDFSSIIRNSVEIMDSSSLLKFFMSPEIKGIVFSSEITERMYQKLWKEDYPSVEDFKKFLECPIAIKPFVSCYKGGLKPLIKIKKEDYNITYFDYSLIKDPYEEINSEIFKSKSAPVRSNKIERNDPCPCGSGKKYKRCCNK